MSLRAFHIFFIIVSISFLGGFCIRQARVFQESGAVADVLFSIASFVLGILLVLYLRWFISKQKKSFG